MYSDENHPGQNLPDKGPPDKTAQTKKPCAQCTVVLTQTYSGSNTDYSGSNTDLQWF